MKVGVHRVNKSRLHRARLFLRKHLEPVLTPAR